MRAGNQASDHGGGSSRSSSRRRLGDQEKGPEPGSQDPGKPTDKSASGRNAQGQAPSALKALQHQLESFQALRRQTLQSVSMVQSEINGILNKNLADVKHPEFNPDPLLLTSTPICVDMPRCCQEASLLKNQLHLDKRFVQYRETYPDKTFGDAVTDGNIPHHVLTKCQSCGKAHALNQTPREKAMLAFKHDHKLKNSSPWDGFKTESSTTLSEKSYARSKDSTAFRAGKDDYAIEGMNSSFRDMKEGNQNTSRRKLPYTFEVQNTSIPLYGKDNDSGYLSEQDPTEKSIDTSSEGFKPKRTSELDDSVDDLHFAMASLKENNQTAVQSGTESRHQNKEFFVKGNMYEKLQLNFLPKTVEDKYFILEHTEERKKDNQVFQKQKLLELGDINAKSDSYCKESGLLEMSPNEFEHSQKKVVDLQFENLDLKKQMKSLTGIIQSLTEQNLNYQKQIKDLQDEKSNIQERLAKSDGDCKECIKEIKKLLKKCKELEQQKVTLKENQDHLYAQNQRIMCSLGDAQKKEQEAHVSLASLTQEKSKLVEALGTLESQMTTVQGECKALEEKARHLTGEKSSLEQKLEEKQKEIQQLKENEKTRQSEIEFVRRMTESLKEEKLKLEKILQESSDLRKVLQKEVEEAHRERAKAEEKLLNESKNARVETGVLKTNLSNMERECERLSAIAGDVTEDNWALKKELYERKQEVSDYQARTGKLSEELMLMENKIRSTETERDALKLEVNRLHRNNVCLREQVTSLFSERYDQRYTSRSRRPNGDPANPTEICEEMSSFQHISVKYNSPECGRIAEIRRKLEEAERRKEEGPSSIRQHYGTVSVSCTTSVIRESSFHTAVQKKYSTLCTAT